MGAPQGAVAIPQRAGVCCDYQVEPVTPFGAEFPSGHKLYTHAALSDLGR